MKKIHIISKLIVSIVILASLKFTGCEQEDLDFYVDCDYCLDEIPDFDTIWVSVTINDENPAVPLKFYKGDFEDGKLDWVDTAYSETFWLVSEVGMEYSAKALYKRGEETLIAVDGDKIKVVDGADDCGSPCYYTRGGTLDLKLK